MGRPGGGAKDRRRLKTRGSSRDAGGFIALPHAVVDCSAYRSLSHPARGLLIEVARQYIGSNNGRLLLSYAHLSPRGWTSADVITRAKRELLAGGFIHETVKGRRPNRASWYAVTWHPLDRIPGYDPGAQESFVRGVYRFGMSSEDASLRPPPGTRVSHIEPSRGEPSESLDRRTVLSAS